MGTVGHKHNYAIPASPGLTRFVQTYWASEVDFPCLSSFMQRAKLPQQFLAGACTPAGADCSSALPVWISPAGSICPASLQATQVMTPHLQSQPGYGEACYSIQKAPCMLCLGSHQLLKELLQKTAPPHKREARQQRCLRAGQGRAGHQRPADPALAVTEEPHPGWRSGTGGSRSLLTDRAGSSSSHPRVRGAAQALPGPRCSARGTMRWRSLRDPRAARGVGGAGMRGPFKSKSTTTAPGTTAAAKRMRTTCPCDLFGAAGTGAAGMGGEWRCGALAHAQGAAQPCALWRCRKRARAERSERRSRSRVAAAPWRRRPEGAARPDMSAGLSAQVKRPGLPPRRCRARPASPPVGPMARAPPGASAALTSALPRRGPSRAGGGRAWPRGSPSASRPAGAAEPPQGGRERPSVTPPRPSAPLGPCSGPGVEPRFGSLGGA